MNGRCTVSLRWLITPGMGAPWPCTRAGSYGCHQAPTHQRSLGLTRELRVGSPDPPRARWPSHVGQQPVAPELVGGRDEGPRRAAAASGSLRGPDDVRAGAARHPRDVGGVNDMEPTHGPVPYPP